MEVLDTLLPKEKKDYYLLYHRLSLMTYLEYHACSKNSGAEDIEFSQGFDSLCG